MIKERGNTNASVELFPIQIFIYKHTIPPKSTGFSLNSFGINNLMSQFFGSAHNNTSNQQEQHPVVLTPKRTLTYRASFSKKNTMRQASFCINNNNNNNCVRGSSFRVFIFGFQRVFPFDLYLSCEEKLFSKSKRLFDIIFNVVI